MKLIVGLGNPGKEYANTKHNIGFFVVDNYLGDVKWQSNTLAYYYKTTINSETVIFLKPTTYMNLSGNAVSYFVNYFHIALSDILIIQDDLDLEFGKIRIKNNSSSGGHNGIKSIISALNTQEFLRLKIGIAKTNNCNIIDYVLSKNSEEQNKILSENTLKYKEIIDGFINNVEISVLMNKYN